MDLFGNDQRGDVPVPAALALAEAAQQHRSRIALEGCKEIMQPGVGKTQVRLDQPVVVGRDRRAQRVVKIIAA